MIINGEENITGLVLKNKPYKENDMLLWIYTHDYGKLALIAKGVKKLKSKYWIFTFFMFFGNIMVDSGILWKKVGDKNVIG